MRAVRAAELRELEPELVAVDVIGIDEGQFFPDLLPFCDRQAAAGKVVIVSALDCTFDRKPFRAVCDLVAAAESVTKLCSVCRFCGDDAAFSLRHSDSTELIMIGGKELYSPVCRYHFSAPPFRGPVICTNRPAPGEWPSGTGGKHGPCYGRAPNRHLLARPRPRLRMAVLSHRKRSARLFRPLPLLAARLAWAER